MADKYRHPHASRAHSNIGIEHFFGLDHHFPFFFGRAVFHKYVNMRDDIKGDLLGEVFALHLIIDKNASGLGKQLIHCRIAGPRHGLISRHHHASNFGQSVQRLQSDNQLRS